jgi:hypothetical protein
LRDGKEYSCTVIGKELFQAWLDGQECGNIQDKGLKMNDMEDWEEAEDWMSQKGHYETITVSHMEAHQMA